MFMYYMHQEVFLILTSNYMQISQLALFLVWNISTMFISCCILVSLALLDN